MFHEKYDFNSIKVQLKHRDFDFRTLLFTFQFHKGTIKTGGGGGGFFPPFGISIP